MQTQIFKFTNFANALSFADGAVKAMAVLHGDDSRYWVTTLGNAAQLEKAGFEIVA